MSHAAGRFAPSPSGDFHVGNLRTGVLAHLCARASGRDFLWRSEDLHRVAIGAEESQLADWARLGLDLDGEIVRQSSRIPAYFRVISDLEERGLTYECYCSRKDIASAVTAPHAPPGAYPGTCRSLTEAEREAHRERLAAAGRRPAVRLRADGSAVTVRDVLLGPVTGPVDDFVLRRGDGVVAYNLAVVVDDGESGIDQVVRADDLASSAPRQAYLARLLGFEVPEYVHVPLVLSPSGARLAKRDGPVTLSELEAHGFDFWAWCGRTLGIGPVGSAAEAADRFDIRDLPRDPVVFTPPMAG